MRNCFQIFSLIATDNASYHTRLEEEFPKMSWHKSKTIEWLVYYEIEFDKQYTKFSIIQNSVHLMKSNYGTSTLILLPKIEGEEHVRQPKPDENRENLVSLLNQ